MTSVGEILRQKRLKKKLTLDQVEKDLKIGKKHLEKIENNDWDFAANIYLIGIIKNYARYLDLDEKKVLAFFRREYEKKEEIAFKKKVSPSFLSSDTNRLMRIFFVIVVVIFLFYFGFQIYSYLSPPKVEIFLPQNDIFDQERLVQIKGKTKPESQVFINHNEVYLDKDGFFSFDFPLEKGENQLKIEVVGPNGKKTSLKKKLYRRK